MTEEIEVLQDISQRLHSVNIPYMITGSMAMNLYVRPRMTRDIDIVVELPPNKVKSFVNTVNNIYYVDQESVNRAIHRRPHMFNIIHQRYVIKVDLILRDNSQYAKQAFQRRRSHELLGQKLFVISAEDLILAKLNWARDSHSEMQITDVRTLLKCVQDLDRRYIENWVQQLKLREIWEVVQS